MQIEPRTPDTPALSSPGLPAGGREAHPDAPRRSNRFGVAGAGVKILVAIAAVSAFLSFGIARMPFTAVGPDSVRFMHFAEINADRAVAEGISFKSVVTASLRSIKGMNDYDLHRGRLLQGVAYGVDAMTRWMLPFATLNLLMIFILSINAGLAALLITRGIPSQADRLNAALLAWIALLTTSLVLSPVMLLILYGKYLWITFVLAYFTARRTGWKIFWLVLAAYSDEIGLVAAAIIAFFFAARIVLLRHEAGEGRTGSWKNVWTSIGWGIAAALNVVLVFFGISALVFDAGAGTFTGFAARGFREALGVAQTPWDIVHGVFWRAEVLILGLSFRNTVFTAVLGLAALSCIVLALRRQFVRAVSGDHSGSPKLLKWVRALLVDTRLFVFAFWWTMFVVVAWMILPGRANDLTHYSYPTAILLAVLLLGALFELVEPRKASVILAAVAGLHFVLFPGIVDATSRSVESYLLNDGSVTVRDMQALNRSIEEIRHKGTSPRFESMNNGREIDFSGTWYYSRVRAFGTATQPHWPVQGTARVLAWPVRPPFKCVSRHFLYTRAEFHDRACR